MIVAIVVIAFWVALFIPVVILPFLPQVDTAYAPAPRRLVRRAAKSAPTAAQHEQAA